MINHAYSKLLLATLSLTTGFAGAADPRAHATAVWSGAYDCGAMHSVTSPSPGFTSSVRMVVEGTVASITKESGEIKQTLSGEVRADGTLRLEGVGMRRDTSSAGWRYRFDGRFEGDRFQARGMMFSANLATKLRDCSMTLTRTEAAVSPSGAQAPAAAADASRTAPPAAVQDGPGRVPGPGGGPDEKVLDFTARNDSAVVAGTVFRASPHRYLVNGKKGQALAATLKSGDGARFDLYEPGSSVQMLSGGFVVQGARLGGTPEGTQLDVELPHDGRYLLLVRSTSDRASYTLELAVSGGVSLVGSTDEPWWNQRIVWIAAALVLAALVLVRLIRGKRDRRMFRPD